MISDSPYSEVCFPAHFAGNIAIFHNNECDLDVSKSPIIFANAAHLPDEITAVLRNHSAWNYQSFVETLIWLWITHHHVFGGSSLKRIVIMRNSDSHALQHIQEAILAAMYPDVELVDSESAFPANFPNALVIDLAWATTTLNAFLEGCLSFRAPQVERFSEIARRAVGAFNGQNPQPRILYVYQNSSPCLSTIAEQSLLESLTKWGEVSLLDFDLLPWAKKVRSVAAADILVGGHGQELTNVVWMRPGSLLLEFFPKRFHQYSFQFLAELCKVDYFGFEGDSIFPAFVRPGPPYGSSSQAKRLVDSTRIANVDMVLQARGNAQTMRSAQKARRRNVSDAVPEIWFEPMLLPDIFPENPLFDIVFGLDGNATNYQSGGWSNPEVGFTWSIGPVSSLRLPRRWGHGDWLLALEGEPFLNAPGCPEQLIQVEVEGKRAATIKADRPFTRVCRLSGRSLPDGNVVLQLRHPRHDSPANYGAHDTRQLGVAWKRIRIFHVQEAKSIMERLSSNEVDVADGLPTSIYAQELEQTVDAQALEELILLSLTSGDFTALHDPFRIVHPGFNLSLQIERQLAPDFSVVRCTVDCNGTWTFGFSESWLGQETEQSGCRMIVWHWLAVLPFFVAYSRSGRVAGSVLLNLADEAHGRGVGFCARTSETLLIPDPYFMRSRAYRDLKRSFSSQSVSFQDRVPKALWRGGTTGYRAAADGLLDLDRVRLCMCSNQAGFEGLLDAGFTNFVQLSQSEEQQLRQLGLVRSYVPPECLSNWMFNIDIDGNTNSWPGLFQKLLAGGTVLKVESKGKWKQWYYDRLFPGVHYVPVSNDLSDLSVAIRGLLNRPKRAAEIGSYGADLAMSMTYETELDNALAVFEDAMAQELLLYPSVTDKS